MSEPDVAEKVKKVFGVDNIVDMRVVDSVGKEREVIYSEFFEGANITKIGTILGKVDGVVREFVYGIETNGEIKVPCVSCTVTFDDMSLSECVEYCFADEQPYPKWHLAKVSVIAIEDFKAKKFKLWENQLKAPECEAAFRRLLQQGPIRNVYDKFIFPTPEECASKYKVTDEHSGKVVDIPHQVSRMRIWNPVEQAYDEFDPGLVGAPTNPLDTEKYWSSFLEELRESRGKDYIDSLLGV
jgi:hypothetical protein